jgi:hypothetical protein
VSGGGVPDEVPPAGGTNGPGVVVLPFVIIGTTRMMISSRSTAPAAYHGRFGFPAADFATGAPATDAPHRVQKRAPGTSVAPQSAQLPERSDAPHAGQKLPLDSVPQLEHFILRQ